MSHPIHYTVERPERFTRAQLAVRLVAFLILGLLGVSFGTLLLVAYLSLPVYAAIRAGAGARFVEDDAPRVLGALRWFAAVCAWAGLTADRLPGKAPEETVHVSLDEGAGAQPTVGSAILRVLQGIPSAIVLALAGVIGVVVWVWAALSILFVERVGPAATSYLVGLQRWSVRLLAYQASLVEAYPPFNFADQPQQRLGPPASVGGEARQ